MRFSNNFWTAENLEKGNHASCPATHALITLVSPQAEARVSNFVKSSFEFKLET